MNRYERPKGLTSYETVEQFIKAMNAGNDINGFLEQEVNDKALKSTTQKRQVRLHSTDQNLTFRQKMFTAKKIL